ncbi:MAG: NUDIX hydrolase [Gammaproteobacteria bacterium]|nr:NUDIX hydrolase [Gammaproteobacteria bacterium]
MNFCSLCGNKVILKIPEGDNLERYVCQSCHQIHYQNPNIVAGVLPTWKDQVLLCKRAIEPRYGLWTLPAGFMENGESIEQAARREAYEEATVQFENVKLYLLISLPHINQVYMMFQGEMSKQQANPGVETLETRLYKKNDIPWENLAFDVIKLTLEYFYQDKKQGKFQFRNIVYERN